MKKEFTKFFVASLKRTAQNVSPLLKREQKLREEIKNINAELALIEEQIEVYDAPIKLTTGGYGVEDLVERVVESTDKVDKNGNTIKITKWVLKYPDTVIPPTEEKEEKEENVEEESNNNSEVSEGVNSFIFN